jgi:hypothetical protein
MNSEDHSSTHGGAAASLEGEVMVNGVQKETPCLWDAERTPHSFCLACWVKCHELLHEQIVTGKCTLRLLQNTVNLLCLQHSIRQQARIQCCVGVCTEKDPEDPENVSSCAHASVRTMCACARTTSYESGSPSVHLPFLAHACCYKPCYVSIYSTQQQHNDEEVAAGQLATPWMCLFSRVRGILDWNRTCKLTHPSYS